MEDKDELTIRELEVEAERLKAGVASLEAENRRLREDRDVTLRVLGQARNRSQRIARLELEVESERRAQADISESCGRMKDRYEKRIEGLQGWNRQAADLLGRQESEIRALSTRLQEVGDIVGSDASIGRELRAILYWPSESPKDALLRIIRERDEYMNELHLAGFTAEPRKIALLVQDIETLRREKLRLERDRNAWKASAEFNALLNAARDDPRTEKLLDLLDDEKPPSSLAEHLLRGTGFRMSMHYWRLISRSAWRWLRDQVKADDSTAEAGR
jgi:hypothetical protein